MVCRVLTSLRCEAQPIFMMLFLTSEVDAYNQSG